MSSESSPFNFRDLSVVRNPEADPSPTNGRRKAGRPRGTNRAKAVPISVEQPSGHSVNPEDRQKARTILAEIGDRFADNRKKGRSNAYETYQEDIARNLNYLIAGGLMSMKEASELFMKLEDFRRQSTQGRTPVEALAEFLRGDLEEPKPIQATQ